MRETAGSIIDSHCAVFLWVGRDVAHTVKLTRTAFIAKRSMAAAQTLDSPNIMSVAVVII